MAKLACKFVLGRLLFQSTVKKLIELNYVVSRLLPAQQKCKNVCFIRKVKLYGIVDVLDTVGNSILGFINQSLCFSAAQYAAVGWS